MHLEVAREYWLTERTEVHREHIIDEVVDRIRFLGIIPCKIHTIMYSVFDEIGKDLPGRVTRK